METASSSPRAAANARSRSMRMAVCSNSGPPGDVRDAPVAEGVQVAENGVGGVRVVDPDRGGGAFGGGVRADDDGRHAEVGEQARAGRRRDGGRSRSRRRRGVRATSPGRSRVPPRRHARRAGSCRRGCRRARAGCRRSGRRRTTRCRGCGPDGSARSRWNRPSRRPVPGPRCAAASRARGRSARTRRAGLVGDTGAVVERERDRADGHAGPRGDVGDRRPTLGGHGLDYSALVAHSRLVTTRVRDQH